MLNHITIMGRLTRDPELRRTGSGIAVAKFTLAVEDDYKGQDGTKKTIFVDCSAWRGTGELAAKFFSKGRMAVVSGKLDIRDYTDKDGNKRKATEVVAENVYFADSKRDNADSGNSYTAPPAVPAGHGVTISGANFSLLEDDDAQLPF